MVRMQQVDHFLQIKEQLSVKENISRFTESTSDAETSPSDLHTVEEIKVKPNSNTIIATRNKNTAVQK